MRLMGLLAIAAIALGGNAAAQDKLALKLDWSLYGTHTVFYQGVVKGLYRAENIDLTIAEGNSSGNVVRLVAQGADPLAFIDMGTMAIGASNGMPVRAIYGVHQRNPMVIISRAEAPVRTPKELEGKIVAMAPSESTAQIFPALLARNQVEAGKISVLNPAIGAKNALLMQGRADAVTGVTYFALPLFAANNTRTHHFFYADNGVPGLESGIVANVEWLEKNRELATRFLRATTRAFALAKSDPAATVGDALTIRRDRERDRGLLTEQLKLSLELLASPNAGGLPFGAMAEADWRAMIEVLTSTGQIKQALPLERYFTNELNAN